VGKDFEHSSFLFGSNSVFIEELYQKYLQTLGELVNVLNRTYSGSVAVEFSHVENSVAQEWLYNKLDSISTHINLSLEEKKQTLQDLVEVEGFEQYLHVKFPGAKRFSIEGGDASIISLDRIIEESASIGAEEAVIGLAHRGRL